MSVPHHFPSLIEGPAQAVLIVGAGLSCPDLPLVNGLTKKLEEFANLIGVSISLSCDHKEYFYALAEAVLNTQGDTHENRLHLAEYLGLLDDRRWFGEIGVHFSGSTPRHRAIARFAVEKRLRSIISLNWDALLETALESVGLANGPKVARPWDITAHANVVHDKHLPLLSSNHVFPVIKPHGCVRDLKNVKRDLHANGNITDVTFKLTQSELKTLPAGQNAVDKKVGCYVTECPSIAVGWRAFEKYLRDTVKDAAKIAKRTEIDAFTVVNIEWDTNHDELCTAYKKNKFESFLEVKEDTQPTTDCMFQWLQARYALTRLIAVAPISHKSILQQQMQQLVEPDCNHHILKWADNWLPVWVRLCWRVGAMGGVDPYTNRRIESWEIPIMPRNVHVPIGGLSHDRLDLQAAAKLLVVLKDVLDMFNFDMFPGGMWNSESRNLYIPLPCWSGSRPQSDLAALKPLMEAMRGKGFIGRLYLVWLDFDDSLSDTTLRSHLEAQVSRQMPFTHYAEHGAVKWVSLNDLRGKANAGMA